MAFEINCVEKDHRYSPYEAIVSVGGPNPNGERWKLTQKQVIEWIEKGHDFYVKSARGSVRVVVARSRFDNLYIKTEADGTEPNNLLSLSSCPWGA